MLHKTASIHALVFTALMLAVSASQASGYVGSEYRHHHQHRQYSDHHSRHHERQEYREHHHNRYHYYGHSPYFSYRPRSYAYRYDYRPYYYRPYQHRSYPGHGGYHHPHGGLFFRLY